MENENKMSLFDHLGELRKRIMISLAAVLVVFILTFNYSEMILKTLVMPIENKMVFSLHYPFIGFEPSGIKQKTLVFTEPSEAFWMHCKISLVAALMIALPVVLSQIWLFIEPGLIEKEKRLVIPFITGGTVLFMIGAVFCFYIILPFAFGFLMTYKTENLTPMITVGKYIDFTMKFLLAFGVIFELPIALLVMTKMGFVTPQKLGKARRHIVVVAFIVASVITPTPDAFNQMLMAVPIIVLYEIGILASRLIKVKPTEQPQPGESTDLEPK
ncbi:twin-arginine translocase subunit TatC [Candidatus Magnetominusculus xianensis]|uniref:Sec-independent protein translocase protein TatC n=1 Tax=Candidatus Magnetominusculus xianensis TaxID=1748249 RepID=A0ABR5SJT9_9BACT|nr:twin-arginine translocase subunit TatC [Candidatus Magnetominusculus xianensis]KWT92771.1 sec-independent protein translocase protein TatC [Candidatus Magnetominusculus xianensis]MBF0405225.1 twin-arginine translocase subunit TatC [Nitrospirota bacterium]